MLDWLFKAAMVLLGFGFLIFVHELGHFLAAKAVGVRVVRFCLGFPPILFSYTSRPGGTTYGLGMIPLGGFVQMAGQDDFDPAEWGKGEPDEFHSKRPAARAVILVAGVTMNAVAGILVFLLAFWIGIAYEPPEVGPLRPGDAAYKAGFRSRDRVVRADGRPVHEFRDIRIAAALAGKDAEVKYVVRRGGRELADPIRLKTEWSEAFGAARAGLPRPLTTRRYAIGCTVREPNGGILLHRIAKGDPAAKAGLRAGDIVVEVEGCSGKALTGSRFRKLIKSSEGKPLAFRVRRPTADGHEELEVAVAPKLSGDRKDGQKPRYLIGVELATRGIIGEVQPGSPAAAAGLRPGDWLAEIERFQGDDTRVTLIWARWPGPKTLGPRAFTSDPASGWKVLELEHYKLHVERYPVFGRAKDPMGNLISAPERALRETRRSFSITYVTVGALLARKASPKNIAGPIGIAHVTAMSLRLGMGQYLWFLAFLSLNLAVINLLPIPVLDGGHLTFLGYEAVRGRPAPKKVQEYALFVGFAMVVLLVLYVTSNDILRVFGLL